MKKLLMLILVLVSLSLWARNDIDLSSFNKEIMKNMQEVLDENPQIYEKNNVGRSPASINETNVERTEQLDNFEEQATGPNEL